MNLQVTYHLPSTAQSFLQTLLYDTTLFSVTYEDRNLFQGEHLLFDSDANNAIQIRLLQARLKHL